MYLYSADWSVSSLYLDPVVLLIQVKGSVVLAAKTSVGALHRVSIGIVVLTYQSPGRRFLRKVSVLLAQAVSWIRTNRVFVSDVGYPVQETFDFVLALFEPFNSCSLERHNRLRITNKSSGEDSTFVDSKCLSCAGTNDLTSHPLSILPSHFPS